MYSSDSSGQKSQQRSDNNNASTRSVYNNGGGGSRHMACKTCRERKVRCDGGQPACEKCQRASEECIYTMGSRKTKTDLVESMEMLQERLARAESALAVRDAQAQNGSLRPGSLASSSFPTSFDLASSSPCLPQPTSSSLQFTSNPQYMVARTPLKAPNPSILPSGSMPFIADASMDPSTNLVIPSDDSMFPSMSGFTTIADPSYSYESFAAPIMKDQSHWPNPEQRKDENISPTSPLPSRQDVRKWNATLQDEQQSSNAARPGTPAQADTLTHFAAFAKTMGAINTDIMGVALTLADYLAWVRKKPDECHDRVLEIFETRAREIAEMAASRTAAAIEETTASFANIAGPENHLSRAGADIAKIRQEKIDFFHSGYEIHRSLAEQYGNQRA